MYYYNYNFKKNYKFIYLFLINIHFSNNTIRDKGAVEIAISIAKMT